MVEYVQLSQQELVQQFGISRRLAVRVGALLARGIGVSGAVLELAKPGSATERLLLSPDLFDNAARMTDALLKDLIGRTEGLEERLTLAEGSQGVRTIALEEEVEASEKTLATLEQASLAPFTPVAAALAAIGHEEARKLFTPEEISRLKLIVLTSADPSKKIEAIRQLVLCPGGAGEKGIVLIHALADGDAGVRIEAAEALTALGLTPGIASAARSLSEGNVKQRMRAAERLSVLAEKVSEPEISVILTMLSRAIEAEESADVKKTLIHSFKGACGIVASDKAYAAEMVRLLVRQLEGAEEVFYRPIREILGAVGHRAPEIMTDLIMNELSAIRSVTIRRLLFGVLAMFEVPESKRAELAAIAIRDLEGSETPEEECQGIGSMLCEWGAEAAKQLLAGLPGAEDASKIYMVRLIDEIVCRRGGEAALEDAGRTFLNLLRVSGKHVGLPIMESNLITSPKLSRELRSQIAREFIAIYGTHANPRVNDVIEAGLVKLGEPALAAISEVLMEEESRDRRASACRVMAEIVKQADRAERGALAERMLDVCMKRWREGLRDGYLAETIGKLIPMSGCGREKIAEIADEFKSVVFETSDPIGVLAGLGELSASPKLDAMVRFDIAQTFIELLDGRLPDLSDRVLDSNTNDNEEVHCVGKEVTAYVDMIPACLEGLEKLYVTCEAQALRLKIVRFLINKWRETSTWSTIWGPEAIGLLMKKVSRIARESSTDDESASRLVAALAEHIDFEPVLLELRKIFTSEDSSQAIGTVAVTVARKLLQKLPNARETEKGMILETLGCIAARTNLCRDPNEARKLREKVLQALYQGLREGCDEAVAALRRLGACPALAQALRNEIAARLSTIHSS